MKFTFALLLILLFNLGAAAQAAPDSCFVIQPPWRYSVTDSAWVRRWHADTVPPAPLASQPVALRRRRRTP